MQGVHWLHELWCCQLACLLILKGPDYCSARQLVSLCGFQLQNACIVYHLQNEQVDWHDPADNASYLTVLPSPGCV